MRGQILFKQYVLKFIKEASDRGIFARWIEGTSLDHTKSLIEFENHMKDSGCSDFLINTMLQCWEDFSKIPNARTSIAIYYSRGKVIR